MSVTTQLLPPVVVEPEVTVNVTCPPVPEFPVPLLPLLEDIRGLEGVDDDDRLPLAVEACVDERVNVVGMPDLIRVVTGNSRGQADLASKEAVVRAGRAAQGCLWANYQKRGYRSPASCSTRY